jgi:hypothetical protein
VTAVLAFLGGPIGRWLVIGAIALAAAFAWGEKRNASGYERGINKGYAEMKAREDAWLAAMARKQTNLNALTKDFDKRTAELEGKLQGKEAERLAALKKLRERIPNVQALVTSCSVTTPPAGPMTVVIPPPPRPAPTLLEPLPRYPAPSSPKSTSDKPQPSEPAKNETMPGGSTPPR